MINFNTHPEKYQHWSLEIKGQLASLKLNVNEEGGLYPGYKLKLNSYDLGVDIELNDAGFSVYVLNILKSELL
ncbi:MAG: hypothetical protein CM1200mP30_00110 [Pseudomonadota bacterium]|nr:MAG: hypothetical protein CM1200mP30_00110 [Pseudomonadota bacterium]